jgi:hypothetical protein
MIRTLFTTLALLLAMADYGRAEEKRPANHLDIASLAGSWMGAGMFVMPVTGFEMEVEAMAEMSRDADTDFYRTLLTGTKFMYTYADSGHLWIDPGGDSLRWEVWDGFNGHAIYYGRVEGNQVFAGRRPGARTYRLQVSRASADSVDMTLDYMGGESARTLARFSMGRKR